MRRWIGAGLAIGLGALSLAAGMQVRAAPAGMRDASLEPVTVSIQPLAGTVAAATGPTLVFATFNVCKTDCAAPAPPWDVRRDRIARTIAEASPDVIGLQEATFQPTTFAKTQLMDIENLLAPFGYVAPTMTADSDTCHWTAVNPHACTHGTGLLFRADRVRQVATPNGTPSAGTLPMSAIAPGLAPDSAPRKVAWAYLQGTSGTGTFLAVAVHTSNLKDADNEASRLAFGTALDAWLDAHNAAHAMAGVPVVLLADLNSYAKRQPHGVQQILRDAGWLDAATATQRRNVQYSTINYNPQLALNEQGFPAKPYEFKPTRRNPVVDATRIDYVMARGTGLSPVDYEVVIRLNADGTFNPEYQGSDHQMVRATIAFPAG
jgi:endonuclease/exonuclease/phosphatase family metal-dependent hydrolase